MWRSVRERQIWSKTINSALPSDYFMQPVAIRHRHLVPILLLSLSQPRKNKINYRNERDPEAHKIVNRRRLRHAVEKRRRAFWAAKIIWPPTVIFSLWLWSCWSLGGARRRVNYIIVHEHDWTETMRRSEERGRGTVINRCLFHWINHALARDQWLITLRARLSQQSGTIARERAHRLCGCINRNW